MTAYGALTASHVPPSAMARGKAFTRDAGGARTLRITKLAELNEPHPQISRHKTNVGCDRATSPNFSLFLWPISILLAVGKFHVNAKQADS